MLCLLNLCLCVPLCWLTPSFAGILCLPAMCISSLCDVTNSSHARSDLFVSYFFSSGPLYESEETETFLVLQEGGARLL